MASQKPQRSIEGTPVKLNKNTIQSYTEGLIDEIPHDFFLSPFEEVGLHKKMPEGYKDDTITIKYRNEDEEMPCASTEQPEVYTTPKSLKQHSPYVKRWASVVKAQKNLSTEFNVSSIKRLGESTEITSEIIDCIFKTLPKSFDNHKGFIFSRQNVLFCSVCSIELESVTSLSNHLKTRRHEDNVITFLKDKIPSHLHYAMEFVSFYDSNLCCNLCQCNIGMSSHDLYETIVNIIAHNAEPRHSSQRADHEIPADAHNLVKSMASVNQEIKQNMHFIEKKMNPQFKCKLCNKNIPYDEKLDILTQNFISHLRSSGHTKNLSAVETLKLFEEANLGGNGNFVVLSGNISCTYCNHQVEADLEKLISHVNGVEHATNVLTTLELTSTSSKLSENKMIRRENKINEVKSDVRSDEKNFEEKTGHCNKKNIPSKTRLHELLNSMPRGFKHIDYVIENENGSVTCLVCNRVVPPNTYNLRTHLLGAHHRKNEELNKNQTPGKADAKILLNGSKQVTKTELSKSEQKTNKENDLLKVETKVLANLKLICKTEDGVSKKSDNAHKQLAHDQQKNKEKMCFRSCPKYNLHGSSILDKIPKLLRVYQCHNVERIPSAIINRLYSLVLKRNPFVHENNQYLEQNVDGKHIYCKPCKSLIPISMDFNSLESNIVLHLKEKKHKISCFNEQGKIPDKSSNEKVARSLFFNKNDNQGKEVKEDAKLTEFQLIDDHGENPFVSVVCGGSPLPKREEHHNKFKQDNVGIEGDSINQRKIMHNLLLLSVKEMYPELASKITIHLMELPNADLLNIIEDKRALKSKVEDIVNSLQAQVARRRDEVKTLQFKFNEGLQKDNAAEVFIFGKEDESIKTKSCKNTVNNSTRSNLPLKSKAEEETDVEVLSRRQKQIDYGKNTEGYIRYSQIVPRKKRNVYQPATPPKWLKCSRRTWDGLVRVWRRNLHSWDSPSTLATDIQPLVSTNHTHNE